MVTWWTGTLTQRYNSYTEIPQYESHRLSLMYDLYKLIIVNQFDNNDDEVLPKLPRSFCVLFQVKKQGYFFKEGQSTKKLLI